MDAHGIILHTEDGNGTWSLQTSGTIVDLSSVAFARWDRTVGERAAVPLTPRRILDGDKLRRSESVNKPVSSARWTSLWSVKSVERVLSLRLLIAGALAMILATFGMTSALLAQSANYSTIVAQAKADLSDGNNEQALTESQNAIKMDPSRWEAYLVAAGALQAEKQYDRAVDEYGKAEERAPEPKKVAIQNLLERCRSEKFGTAWAVSEDGNILRTDDGGSTWKIQTTAKLQPRGLNLPLLSITFATPQSGWAVGVLGMILHTDDGGNTWKQQTSGTEHILTRVAVATAQSVWVVDNQQPGLMHTDDGGRIWKSQDKEFLSGVAFATLQSGWKFGDKGLILHTDDGGNTWKPQTSGTSESMAEIDFATPLSAWAVGGKGLILHTDDGGNTWKPQTSGTSEDLSSVAVATPHSAWAVGRKGVILHTDDSGNTWKPQTSGTSVDLNSIACSSPKTCWSVGDRGTILHTDDGGHTWKAQGNGTNGTREPFNQVAIARWH